MTVVGTRDCTLQRRHQKIVEEAPAPFLSSAQTEIIAKSAKDICISVGYVGAGTVEYLLGRDGGIWFLEVNTRLQVEHPVTEETGGIDIVCEQFRIATGGTVIGGGEMASRGHSIEFRINTEDPAKGFAPSLGTISGLRLPAGPGVRVDAGIENGDVIGGQFDSLIAKLIVTGADRNEALRRARRALDEFSIEGVATSLSLHRAIVRAPEFSTDVEGDFLVHTGWLESDLLKRVEMIKVPAVSDLRDVTLEIGGRPLAAHLPMGLDPAILARRSSIGTRRDQDGAGERVLSPMQGTVISVAVTDGQPVAEGDQLFVIEAMKMENAIVAHRGGTVADLNATQGQSVRQGLLLCRIARES
jgi:acetyl-CoA/propionyl-CoA carboxylase biotin carboxyl carrier protein